MKVKVFQIKKWDSLNIFENHQLELMQKILKHAIYFYIYDKITETRTKKTITAYKTTACSSIVL